MFTTAFGVWAAAVKSIVTAERGGALGASSPK
jgi:hypothetical protein